MKTPKSYRLSETTLRCLEDLQALETNRYRTETDIIEYAIQELWTAQKLMGINQPSVTLARTAKAGD